MEVLNLINLDAHYVQVLLINMGVAIALLFVTRSLLAITTQVSSKTELADNDNPAYGVSLAGIVFAITIVMTGVLSGKASYDLVEEFFSVLLFGSLGVVLMIVANFIFDKLSMPKVSIPQEIKGGNLAAGLINAGNLIATAIIVRAVIIWSDLDAGVAVIAAVAGFLLSQVILTLVSKYRIGLFNANNTTTFQNSILDGNLAVAWRFTGFRIAVALAITAASGLVPAINDGFIVPMVLWTVVSLVMLGLISILHIIVDKILLGGIDLRDEVDSQQNIAIGVAQASIIISVGLIVAALTN